MQETRDKLLQKEHQELMQKLHREAAEREVWKNRQNARLEKERIAKECKEQERLAQLKEWKEVLAIRNSASVFPPPPTTPPPALNDCWVMRSSGIGMAHTAKAFGSISDASMRETA